MRDARGLDQSSSRGGGERWSDAGYILKMESSGFGYRLKGIKEREESKITPTCLV